MCAIQWQLPQRLHVLMSDYTGLKYQGRSVLCFIYNSVPLQLWRKGNKWLKEYYLSYALTMSILLQ